jgi:hypothetical protein
MYKIKQFLSYGPECCTLSYECTDELPSQMKMPSYTMGNRAIGESTKVRYATLHHTSDRTGTSQEQQTFCLTITVYNGLIFINCNSLFHSCRPQNRDRVRTEELIRAMGLVICGSLPHERQSTNVHCYATACWFPFSW